MLYERIMYRLLNESKIVSLTNRLSKQVMLGIRDRIDRINSTAPNEDGVRGYRISKTVSNDRTQKDFKLIIVINVYPAKNEKTIIEAMWDWEAEELNVYIKVFSKTGLLQPQHLRSIQDNLYGAIRHELEHSTQGPELAAASIKSHDDLMTNPADLQRRKDYYTNPAELPAFVSGFAIEAKKLRKPIEDVIGKYLEKIKSAMTRNNPSMDPSKIQQAIDDIKTAWMDYAKEKYKTGNFKQ